MGCRPGIAALLLLLAVTGGRAIWIGEDFWTTVHYNGEIERGRSENDFIHFKMMRDYDPLDEYVAYWIDDDDAGRWETYGEAFVDDNRICARFRKRDGGSNHICGGFRVLSRGRHDNENPFVWQPASSLNRERAVEYLSHEIARIYTKQKVASIFGGAYLDHAAAYGIDPNSTVVRIARSTDPEFFDENIEILTVRDGYFPRQSSGQSASRPAEINVPQPRVDTDNLPRIYHSERYDHQRIPDRDTWFSNHPHQAPRPYYDQAVYDPYDTNRNGILEEEERRNKFNNRRRSRRHHAHKKHRQAEEGF